MSDEPVRLVPRFPADPRIKIGHEPPVGAIDNYYRPPALYQGCESLEDQLKRKHTEKLGD